MVVVHPPFRWQRDYAREFVQGIEGLEQSTGIAFAVENMYPWRASAKRGMQVYLPGWDPSEEDYANATIDLSHSAVAHSDPVAMARRLGDRLRHIHLTDGTGSAKDEHLVPGSGHPARRGAARPPCRTRASPATSCSRSTPARRAPPSSASRDLAESLAVRARALRAPGAARDAGAARRPGRRGPGRAAGVAGHPRPAILAAARELFAAHGFAGTTIRAVAAQARVDPALVHHYFGTKDDLFLAALELQLDPREVMAAGDRRRARTARGSG